MARKVSQWAGKDDNSPVPARVRLRVFIKFNGRCQICTRKIEPGERWVCDHKQAIINEGANNEDNLWPICDWCDKKTKTPADVAEKSITYRKRLKHHGLKKPKGRPIPGSKRSGLKRRFDGAVVKR